MPNTKSDAQAARTTKPAIVVGTNERSLLYIATPAVHDVSGFKSVLGQTFGILQTDTSDAFN